MMDGEGFEVIDASRPIENVFEDLKNRVSRLADPKGRFAAE
jgi:thymidylate kinase